MSGETPTKEHNCANCGRVTYETVGKLVDGKWWCFNCASGNWPKQNATRSSNRNSLRKPPRADRRDPLGCFCRCRLCDWETINGEGVTIPRACCPEGLKFDLDHGLTPDGLGQWREVPTSSADETTAPRETGWLIENGRPAPKTEYRGMDEMGIHWTADINKALRFARRADAEAFASGDVNAWAVVQHEWVIVDGDSIHAVEPKSPREVKTGNACEDEVRIRCVKPWGHESPHQSTAGLQWPVQPENGGGDL